MKIQEMGLIIQSNINRTQQLHFRENKDPEYWIPGQARNDKGDRTFVIICILLLTTCCFLPSGTSASEKWSGVDETVVEQFAKAQGREAREPLINTGGGDLLLFLFLLAGAVGGFAAGYYWRMLIVEKAPKKK